MIKVIDDMTDEEVKTVDTGYHAVRDIMAQLPAAIDGLDGETHSRRLLSAGFLIAATELFYFMHLSEQTMEMEEDTKEMFKLISGIGEDNALTAQRNYVKQEYPQKVQ